MKRINDKVIEVSKVIIPIEKINYITVNVSMSNQIIIEPDVKKITFNIQSGGTNNYDAYVKTKSEPEKDYFDEEARIWSYDLKYALKGITHIDIPSQIRFEIIYYIGDKKVDERIYEDIIIHYDEISEFIEECNTIVNKKHEEMNIQIANELYSENFQKSLELKEI